MRAACGKGGPIGKLEHINSIFGNVKGIAEANALFLEELENIVGKNWSDTQSIGELFTSTVLFSPPFYLFKSNPPPPPFANFVLGAEVLAVYELCIRVQDLHPHVKQIRKTKQFY